MVCLVMSTGCLVMSTGCLVVSTGCLVVSTGCLVVSTGCLVVSTGCLVVSYTLSSGYITAYGNGSETRATAYENGRRLFGQPLMEMVCDKVCEYHRVV
jgi:hypothetical protein